MRAVNAHVQIVPARASKTSLVSADLISNFIFIFPKKGKSGGLGLRFLR